MRVAIAIVGSLITCLLYGLLLEALRDHYGVNFMALEHAELFIIMLIPLLICVVWAVMLNLWSSQSWRSLLAVALSVVFSYPLYVILFGFSFDCALLGGCL